MEDMDAYVNFSLPAQWLIQHSKNQAAAMVQQNQDIYSANCLLFYMA